MVSETEQTAIGKKRLQIVTFQTNVSEATAKVFISFN